MKTITFIVCSLTLSCMAGGVLAQAIPPVTSSSPVADGTPIPLTLATVSAFVPDKTIDIQIGIANPTQYRMAKSPVYVGSDGSVVDSSAVKPGMKVSVHFMTDGGEIIIDRVFLQ